MFSNKTVFFDTPFAKINLNLRLIGKRRDGYHNLDTVFYRVNLCDQLLLIKQPRGFSLECSEPTLSGTSNLIYTAFRLLQKKIRKKLGVSVLLHKQIPMQAGLGGGSSDAASFLRGMNRLHRLGLSNTQLRQIGGQLGADVPFFVTNWSAARGTGRGDIMRKLSLNKDLYVVLVTFSRGLSTKKVFERYKYGPFLPKLTKVSADATMLSSYFEHYRLGALSKLLKNDLKPFAVKEYPSILQVLKKMQEAGIRACSMSGSGPTVFGIVKSHSAARRVQAKLQMRLRGCQIWITSGI